MITKDNLRQKLGEALGTEGKQEAPKVEKPVKKSEYSDLSIEIALKKLK